MRPEIAPFFHQPTSTWSYVVSDPASRAAAVIDPAMDYDSASGATGWDSVENVIRHIRDRDLSVEWILETHAHADHLSAAAHLRDELGGAIGIGAGIRNVQATFRRLLNLDLATDGNQFDRLFADGDTFKIGGLSATVLATPGHTGDSVSYLIGDAIFVGDTLFMPDVGTARCDFPGGDAGVLYDSIQRIVGLPPDTRLFVVHDYPPDGRNIQCETTVGAQRRDNIHLRDGIDRAQFIQLRRQRDATLPVPRLLYPAMQVNLRAGRLPVPESNGTAYLKIPLNVTL